MFDLVRVQILDRDTDKIRGVFFCFSYNVIRCLSFEVKTLTHKRKEKKRKEKKRKEKKRKEKKRKEKKRKPISMSLLNSFRSLVFGYKHPEIELYALNRSVSYPRTDELNEKPILSVRTLSLGFNFGTRFQKSINSSNINNVSIGHLCYMLNLLEEHKDDLHLHEFGDVYIYRKGLVLMRISMPNKDSGRVAHVSIDNYYLELTRKLEFGRDIITVVLGVAVLTTILGTGATILGTGAKLINRKLLN
jgi:hypothetical protein